MRRIAYKIPRIQGYSVMRTAYLTFIRKEDQMCSGIVSSCLAQDLRRA